MDEVKPFNSKEFNTCGWFYVESKQYFPLRGNGWYSYPIIKYCIDEKLITFENIKFVIKPSIELENN